MDVVWLKRDIRLTDHGPLSDAMCNSSAKSEMIILFLYEPSQLKEKTVHGSHVAFINEGLIELDSKLTNLNHQRSKITGKQLEQKGEFRTITVCYASAIDCLERIHTAKSIRRLLSHEETGHWASYQRDNDVRRWCRKNGIAIKEFPQSGAKRALNNRDDFSKHFGKFMQERQHVVPVSFEGKIVVDLDLPGRTRVPLLKELNEIPRDHCMDRPHRQKGGESMALETLKSFLHDRGAQFSSGISSPNSAWTTCSRLSPYLAWGHISLRHVVQAVKQKQGEIKAQRVQKIPALEKTPWSRSLSAFLSRLHWRTHFIQKLESEPEMELRDLCQAFQHLRRQPGDWNDEYFRRWSTGTTGFPFVDACMRCLLTHGWLNFRMRAMLVSFATYNLWLDWKRIAPHLARVFLDFEPGIHYPQLQMQAGTTGINAMRVYNVVKQGKEQDAKGNFVRRYVPELANVPDEYIQEPWKMTKSVQSKTSIVIGVDYPYPIVDEKESAKVAKERVASVRRQESTKQEASKIYEKHGSRTMTRDRPAAKRSRENEGSKQQTLHDMVRASKRSKPIMASKATDTALNPPPAGDWVCHACTYVNDKPIGLACGVCGTLRRCTDAQP